LPLSVHWFAVLRDNIGRVGPLGHETEIQLIALLQGDRRSDLTHPRARDGVAITDQGLNGDRLGRGRRSDDERGNYQQSKPWLHSLAPEAKLPIRHAPTDQTSSLRTAARQTSGSPRRTVRSAP